MLHLWTIPIGKGKNTHVTNDRDENTPVCYRKAHVAKEILVQKRCQVLRYFMETVLSTSNISHTNWFFCFNRPFASGFREGKSIWRVVCIIKGMC